MDLPHRCGLDSAIAAVLGCALLCVLAVPPSSAHAEDRWSTPHPGVRRLLRTTGGPNRINALVVDLCAPGVSLRATSRGENRRTPSSFGTLVGAEAAINGDFFSYETYAPTGLAIGNDVQWHGDNGYTGFIGFGRERSMLAEPSVVGGPSWMGEAVGGRPHLVGNGAVLGSFTSPSHCSQRHPRTAVGLSEDRRTLILAVVDGRSSSSIGMTCGELARLMHGLGAHEALNLDGGGSSAMWVRGIGVVNRPSDGSQRVVANHLAVHATGSGDAASCNWAADEILTLAESFDAARTTDVDGDGRADLCVRSSAGFRCHLAASGGDEGVVPGPTLSDDSGWSVPEHWATIRMGDIDGDGRADVCARAGAGARCWKSTGTGFGEAIVGPELSNDSGWAALPHSSSLRLADIDADGDDDLCARAGAGFRCYPSTGDGFGDAIPGPSLSNDSGWADPANYGTIRMGDVDGDGRADVCARADAGMLCWLSDGAGFPTRLTGPAWDDAAGFDHVSYWGTIRLVDVDGDDRADLCARTAAGFACHLSTGDGFGEAAVGPGWTDEQGWWDYDNYSTIRMADLDGDGSADVCARANAGVACWLWDGTAHATRIDGPPLSDAANWDEPRYFRTIRLADVTGDGLADLCARGGAGVSCWPSTGAGFDAAIDGPSLADEVGWGSDRYYATMRLAGPACTVREETCNGADDDCDGEIDEGACAAPDGGSTPTPDGGAFGAPDAGPAREGAGDRPASEMERAVGGGCAIGGRGRPSDSAAMLAAAAFLLLVIERRRTRRSRGQLR